LMPDTVNNYSGFGTRFDIIKKAKLTQFRIKTQISEILPSLPEWKIEIRTVKDNKPDSLLYETVLDSAAGTKIRYFLGKGWFVHRMHDFIVPPEFFILASLLSHSPGDTLSLISDKGLLKNNHGYVLKEDGWSVFSAGSRVSYNPFIKGKVYYDPAIYEE